MHVNWTVVHIGENLYGALEDGCGHQSMNSNELRCKQHSTRPSSTILSLTAREGWRHTIGWYLGDYPIPSKVLDFNLALCFNKLLARKICSGLMTFMNGSTVCFEGANLGW